MAIKTIKEESLTALGNAIRIKTGNEALLEFPNGMVNAISGIETSGAIEALDITANGVYNAPEGVDGYNPITVNVPQKEPNIQNLSITTNGTYTAPTGTDGYSPVVVDVQPVLENITITANGTYTHNGKDGYDQVVVNVSGGGSDIPEEAFIITGDCISMFSNDKWSWFVNNYGNRITTENLKSCKDMFNSAYSITSIPFDLNFYNGNNNSYLRMFYECHNITEIGKIINIYPSDMKNFFGNCPRLRYLPEFINPNFDTIHTNNYSDCSNIFSGCYSLREISEDLLNQFWGIMTRYNYTVFAYNFENCYSLDEIRGLNPQTGTITSNMFSSSFNRSARLKNIIFTLQNDSTPYIVNWNNQTIDLTNFIGYGNLDSIKNYIINYNSGITADKEVTDDVSYQALKNDPDWFTCNVAYSRYNHDSAVNTINSLPDTSAFLATNGGTNTIKFKGAAGSATAGGAINTLTAEEIAVATAKGWTVSLS